MSITISFIITALSFAALLFTLINRKYRRHYVTIKMLNSAVFVINLIVMTVLSGNYGPFRLLLPGFILCFVGDLAMGLHNKYVKTKYLMVGTGLFLLGHIFFIAYFYTILSPKVYDICLPMLGAALIFVLSKNKQYNFDKFVVPGMVYALFVCTMAGKSIQIALTFKTAQSLAIGLGGLCFLMSDALIAPLYFKKKRAWVIHGFNIGTYYLAMFLLAVSLNL